MRGARDRIPGNEEEQGCHRGSPRRYPCRGSDVCIRRVHLQTGAGPFKESKVGDRFLFFLSFFK